MIGMIETMFSKKIVQSAIEIADRLLFTNCSF
jgi:hypothetical protein